MNKAGYFIVCLLLVSGLAISQGEAPPPRPNVMGLKMAFITKELSLTNDESQKFWPIYYSYSAEIKKVRQGKKDDILALEEDMLNVRKKYKIEFKKILVNDERVNKALTADRDFMNVVRKELQQRGFRRKNF